MQQLSRGQKIKLADVTPALQLRVGMAAVGAGLAFDCSCFGVDAQGQLSDDRYFIFYNQKSSPENALQLTGARDGDNETFEIDLSRLPETIQKLVFVLTIDGAGALSQLANGHVRLLAGGGEVARFAFSGSDFATEKAIIALEIYRKDVWRVAAVGQGFAGGLSALLKNFGGEEVEETAPPARIEVPPVPVVAPTSVAPPTPSAPSPSAAVNLKKINLEKKMDRQAPQLLSLAKQAQVSLEKANLGDHAAKVALCLDISASMTTLYSSGKIQRFAEKVLALGTRFDDDGSIDIFLFGARAHEAGEMTIDNFSGFVGQIVRQYPLEGGTYYGKAMQMIRQHYFPGGGGARSAPVAAPLPVYVMFVTDGQTGDPDPTRRQIEWAAYEPIFWQFMGLGKSRKDVKKGKGGFWARAFASDFAFLEGLDEMSGRYIDNANFFSVEDPEAIPDAELYDLMMSEYPGWVRQAPAKGLLR